MQPQVWFNTAVRSRDYLVPGLIAIIMTLTGALLTALVMAREWERGTMEALMVTRVTMREVLLAKLIPYFVLGMGGMAASVAMAVWLFGVPLRGSLGVLIAASALFLLAALGMGLLISGFARNQFVAGQIAIITTFLPAFILSGFIFDIGSMPRAVQVITHIVAARYFVAILQTVFLAGDVWSVILPNAAGAGGDGGDLPRPRARRTRASGWTERDVAQVLALIVKELLALLQDAEPHGADRPAADPAAGVRLRGHVRSEPHSVRGLQRGPSPASRDLVARFAGSPNFQLVAMLRSAQPDRRADRFAPGADGAGHRPAASPAIC